MSEETAPQVKIEATSTETTAEHSEDYFKLIEAGLSVEVANALDDVFKEGSFLMWLIHGYWSGGNIFVLLLKNLSSFLILTSVRWMP